MRHISQVDEIIALILDVPGVELPSSEVKNNRVRVAIKAKYRIRRIGKRLRGSIDHQHELDLDQLIADSALVARALGLPFKVSAQYCVVHKLECLRRDLIEAQLQAKVLAIKKSLKQGSTK